MSVTADHTTAIIPTTIERGRFSLCSPSITFSSWSGLRERTGSERLTSHTCSKSPPQSSSEDRFLPKALPFLSFLRPEMSPVECSQPWAHDLIPLAHFTKAYVQTSTGNTGATSGRTHRTAGICSLPTELLC